MGAVGTFELCLEGTDHVGIDSLWMAPWDAGGTLGDSCWPSVATCRTVFLSVVRLSRRPAFVDKDCLRLFGSLRRICVLDVHAGRMEVPTGSLGDDPRMNWPPSLMSPGDGECCYLFQSLRWEVLHDGVVVQEMDIPQAWL